MSGERDAVEKLEDVGVNEPVEPAANPFPDAVDGLGHAASRLVGVAVFVKKPFGLGFEYGEQGALYQFVAQVLCGKNPLFPVRFSHWEASYQ